MTGNFEIIEAENLGPHIDCTPSVSSLGMGEKETAVNRITIQSIEKKWQWKVHPIILQLLPLPSGHFSRVTHPRMSMTEQLCEFSLLIHHSHFPYFGYESSQWAFHKS
ncbi:uncharacterized protein ACOB8E_000788 [Sarcophilus harrisii]